MKSLRKVGRRPFKGWSGELDLRDPESLRQFRERFPEPHPIAEFSAWLDYQKAWLVNAMKSHGLPDPVRWVEFSVNAPGKWTYCDAMNVPALPLLDKVGISVVPAMMYLRLQPVHSVEWFIGMLASDLDRLVDGYESKDCDLIGGRAFTYGWRKREYTTMFEVEAYQENLIRTQALRNRALDQVNGGKREAGKIWRGIVDRIACGYPDEISYNYGAAARWILERWDASDQKAPKPETVAKYLRERYPFIT